MRPTGIVLLLLLAFGLSHVSAQALVMYRAVIVMADNSRLDGILCDVTDSTLRIVPNSRASVVRLRTNDTLPDMTEINYRSIRQVTVLRKGHVGRGLAFGLGLGIVGRFAIAGMTNPSNKKDFLSQFGDGLRQGFIISLPVQGTFLGFFISLFPLASLKVAQNPTLFRLAGLKLRRYSIRGQRPDLTVVR